MVLTKSAAIVVLEILRSLVSMRKWLNGNNCLHKQNYNNFPTQLYLYF